MDNKIKKTIAKEGLMLLGFTLVIVILHFSWTNILAPIIMPKVQFSYAQLPNKQDSDKPRYEFNIKGKKFTIEVDSENLARSDLSEIATQVAITEKIIEPPIRWQIYKWLCNTKDAIFPITFLIYLLIRFIIWAIKTLKQK